MSLWLHLLFFSQLFKQRAHFSSYCAHFLSVLLIWAFHLSFVGGLFYWQFSVKCWGWWWTLLANFFLSARQRLFKHHHHHQHIMCLMIQQQQQQHWSIDLAHFKVEVSWSLMSEISVCFYLSVCVSFPLLWLHFTYGFVFICYPHHLLSFFIAVVILVASFHFIPHQLSPMFAILWRHLRIFFSYLQLRQSSKPWCWPHTHTHTPQRHLFSFSS